MSGWIGVDLDGTLAHYDGWKGAAHIGKPITPMVNRVKAWLSAEQEVRIFTARIWPLGTDAATPEDRIRESKAAKAMIEEWCLEHIGKVLPITCCKDYGMIELWDDRAVQVVINTGARLAGVSV